MLLGLLTFFVWFAIDFFLIREPARRRARSLCGPTCAGPELAVAYLGWNGTVHTFRLASKVFAFEFMLANRSRLINIDYAVLRELEEYVRQRDEYFRRRADAASASNPTPAATPQLQQARPPNADEAAFLEGVEKLERLKGPAARRTHLAASFAKITSPEWRERLIVEASRIEVQAVLEKVDSLKSVNAKKRQLTAALEAIRSDSVADELQAKEIRWLEDALRSLDA